MRLVVGAPVTGTRTTVVLDAKVDMPTAIARLLGVLDVVTLRFWVKTNRAPFPDAWWQVFQSDLNHLDVAQVGARESQPNEIVNHHGDVVDGRDCLAIPRLVDLPPSTAL